MSLLELLYRLAILNRLHDRIGLWDPLAVHKILVLRNDNIGDVVCTTPALDALRQSFPQARIAALVCTLTEEVLSGHPALDVLYAYPKAKHKQHSRLRSLWMLAQTLRQIRREKFDLVVGFRASFSSSQGWLAYASRARWRLGVAAQGKRRRWGFFYNLPAPAPPQGLHEVQRCFHLLRQVQVDSPEKRLYLKVPRPAAQRVERFFQEVGLEPGARPLVLNITRWAYRPDRWWPVERYRRLVQFLAGRSQPLLVTHAPADQGWVRELLAGLQPLPGVFCSPSLKEFAGLLASARAVITAEGGPMHLAAAVATPLVVLWGLTPQEMWRPWGVAHRIVGGAGPVELIEVEEVVAALDDLLQETPPTPAGGE